MLAAEVAAVSAALQLAKRSSLALAMESLAEESERLSRKAMKASERMG